MLTPVVLLFLATILGDADEPLNLVTIIPQKESKQWIHSKKESNTENG